MHCKLHTKVRPIKKKSCQPPVAYWLLCPNPINHEVISWRRSSRITRLEVSVGFHYLLWHMAAGPIVMSSLKPQTLNPHRLNWHHLVKCLNVRDCKDPEWYEQEWDSNVWHFTFLSWQRHFRDRLSNLNVLQALALQSRQKVFLLFLFNVTVLWTVSKSLMKGLQK